jgi:hypothetical protein
VAQRLELTRTTGAGLALRVEVGGELLFVVVGMIYEYLAEEFAHH